VNRAEKCNRRTDMMPFCDYGNASKIDLARQSASVGKEGILSLVYNRIRCHQ